MSPEAKPKHALGYGPDVTEACERALVTLLGAFTGLADTIRLVGGLAPRYITPAAPPHVPSHVGTSDVDVVFNLQVVATGKGNYSKLAKQLNDRGFVRHVDEDHKPASWRWKLNVDGIVVFVEFLRHASDGARPGTVVSVDGEKVSALAVPYAEIAHDWYIKHEITAKLVDGGEVTRTIHVVDAVGFVILKAVAFQERDEPKDAADLIHVLRYAGSPDEVAAMFVARIKSRKHEAAISAGLDALRARFCDDDIERAIRKHGPVAYAQFHRDPDDDEDTRVLNQRYASALVTSILAVIEPHRPPTAAALWTT